MRMSSARRVAAVLAAAALVLCVTGPGATAAETTPLEWLPIAEPAYSYGEAMTIQVLGPEPGRAVVLYRWEAAAWVERGTATTGIGPTTLLYGPKVYPGQHFRLVAPATATALEASLEFTPTVAALIRITHITGWPTHHNGTHGYRHPQRFSAGTRFRLVTITVNGPDRTVMLRRHHVTAAAGYNTKYRNYHTVGGRVTVRVPVPAGRSGWTVLAKPVTGYYDNYTRVWWIRR